MNTKKYKDLANLLGELLAKSNFDEETKELILDKADKLPEHAIHKLIRILEGEQGEIQTAMFDIGLFLREQEKSWVKAEEEQKNAANTLVNKWFMKLS